MSQLRWIAVAGFVNLVGAGLFMSVSVLYFTQVVGFGIGPVALVMSGAGLIGPLAALPIGRLADRYGPRTVLVGQLMIMGVLSFGYVFVSRLWQYAVIAVVMSMLSYGVQAVGGAFVAALTGGGERVRARAYVATVFNLALALGSALAFVVLARDSEGLYRAAVVVDALTFVVSGFLYLRTPVVAYRRPARLSALRDYRFMALVGLFGVLEMHRAVFTVALPIWIVRRTPAPASTVSIVLLINLLGLVLFLMRFARRAENVTAATRITRQGGFFLLLACLMFALAPQWGPLILAGAVVQTVGDLSVATGRFCLTFELADERAQGQYQGLVTVGRGLGAAAGPLVMAGLPLGLGPAGWLLLGLLLLTAGLLVGPVVRAGPVGVH